MYSKCISSCGGIGSPCRCSWGIKRLGAAAHPVEGCGLWCAAACLDVNWLWWQWVPCRYWAAPGQPQTSPSCHPSCQPEGQRCRPAWQEEWVSATYHGAWTGVPEWPVDETEGFEVEGKRRGEEVEKFGPGTRIQTSPPPSMVFNSEKFWTHVWDDRCVFRLVLGSCHWHRHESESWERELAIKWTSMH